MQGQVFKRCTRCPARSRYGDGDRSCPTCGETSFSWYYLVDVDRRPDGSRDRRTKGGFESKRACEEALRELLSRVAHEGYVRPDEITVAQFLLEEWLPAMRMAVAATTLEGYRGVVERYIVPRIGDSLLQHLRPPRINWLYADVRDNGRVRGTGPLSLKTVREVHVVLHRALEDAVRWDYRRDNPASRATPPTATAAKNERKKTIAVWSAADVARFADHIADHRLYPLWLLAVSTGMRRSELLGLRWRDITLERAMLAVRQVLVLVDGQPRFKAAPKTQHGYRTIRLSSRVIATLHRHRRRQTEEQRRTGSAPDERLVFCRPDGDAWHPDYISQTLRDEIRESGLPRIRPLQDLRHTHATLLLADGENTKVVQERLGHHSHSFTADTYQHIMPGMDAAAADRFDSLAFGTDDDAGEADAAGR